MSATQSKGVQAVCVQGNIIGRKPENGAMGKGVNEDLSFTLTEVDRHAVCYSMTAGSFTQVNDNIAPNLMARDFKDPPFVNAKPTFDIDRAAYNQGANALYKPQIDVEGVHSITAQGPTAVSAPPNYVVRRLTPAECLVLMGLCRVKYYAKCCQQTQQNRRSIEKLLRIIND
jgi:DNA (cytosine-5)-methyltransferase 1